MTKAEKMFNKLGYKKTMFRELDMATNEFIYFVVFAKKGVNVAYDSRNAKVKVESSIYITREDLKAIDQLKREIGEINETQLTEIIEMVDDFMKIIPSKVVYKNIDEVITASAKLKQVIATLKHLQKSLNIIIENNPKWYGIYRVCIGYERHIENKQSRTVYNNIVAMWKFCVIIRANDKEREKVWKNYIQLRKLRNI